MNDNGSDIYHDYRSRNFQVLIINNIYFKVNYTQQKLIGNKVEDLEGNWKSDSNEKLTTLLQNKNVFILVLEIQLIFCGK